MSREALRYSRRVFDHFKLSPIARMVLKELAWRHNLGSQLRVSMSTIADQTGTDKRAIRRAIEELKVQQVIIVIYEPKKGRRTAQAYRFPAEFDIPGSAEEWLETVRILPKDENPERTGCPLSERAGSPRLNS